MTIINFKVNDDCFKQLIRYGSCQTINGCEKNKRMFLFVLGLQKENIKISYKVGEELSKRYKFRLIIVIAHLPTTRGA